MRTFIPTPAVTAWLRAEGFVPSFDEEPDSGYWEKAWAHSSGYDNVSFLLIPWAGHGGFTGETFSIVIRVHASGTHPKIDIGICHSLAEIISIYTALSAMSFERHQAFKDAAA